MEYQPFRNIGLGIYLCALSLLVLPVISLAQDVPSDDITASSSTRQAVPVVLTFNCIDGEPGDTICVPITVEDFTDIVIAQLEIIWDSDVLDFIRIEDVGTPSINISADFNQSGPNALKFIPLNLPPITGVTLPDGATLFEICFRIVGTPGSGSCIGISPYFEYEVADITGVIPSDSVACCMNVNDVVDLVGFVHSCGADIPGGNGTIDITVYGGTAPYSITWVDGAANMGGPVGIMAQGGSTTLNVPAETYDVTITDALGASVTYSAEVDAIGLSVITRLRQPTCYKFENGIIWIKPQGGSAPFSYIWESLDDNTAAGSGFIRNPGDSSIVTSLKHGIYSITVEDNNGCKFIFNDTLIYNPYVFNVNNVQNATCNGSADGFIDLTISGATPDAGDAYTILVRPGFELNTNMITIGLLDPGDHCITVTDEVSQCDTVFCFTIGFTDTISATVTPIDVPCAGQANGMVTLRGRTNGIPGPMYSYSIYNNGVLVTTQMNAGNFTYGPLPAGNYTAIVKEGDCLSDSLAFTINEPPPMTISVVGATPDNCLPTGSGDIWFDIQDGAPPYILDAGAGFQDADTLFNLNAGNYILTVTDDNGCTGTLPFSIFDGDDNEEADITFVFDGTPCEGGTVTVLYLGMPIPPNVGVLWSTGEVNDTITITETDTLSVDIILGEPIFCILDDTVHVDCSLQLDLDITVMQPLCGEGALGGPYTGTVIADTINAIAPVTWYWSFPDTTTSGIYTGLAPGKYYVTVVDGLDSMAVDSFEIIAPPTLGIDIITVDSTSCPELCDDAVQLTGANGDPTLDYFLFWDPVTPMSDTGIVFNVNNLCAGLHYFTISQDGNCFYVDSAEIFAPDTVSVDLVQNIDVSCFGLSDGLLEVVASGGNPGYSYTWVNGPANAVNPNIAAGYHHVMVTDARNCVVEDSFLILQPDTLIADIDSSASFNLSCGASDDGVITTEVSGGNLGGYTYTWSPDVSSIYQAVNLTAGVYQVTISDNRGCSDTTSFTLSAPPPITVEWPILEDPACFGDEVLFQITQVTGGSGVYNFTINSGEIYAITDTENLPAGIYIISVFDDRGCEVDTMYMIDQPNPIELSIGPEDPVIDLGDSLTITGSIIQSDNPIATTLWTADEPISCPSCFSTIVFNAIPTLYTWTVTDINGCTSSAAILVNVDYDRNVYIPNVFSPNNDGRNDDFFISTGPGVEAVNFIRIYDRWGNIVHSENDLLPGQNGVGRWDGTYNGESLNPGVFVFVAEIKFLDGETLHFRGDVTLIR